MSRGVAAAGLAVALAALPWLAACPSLSLIGVGTGDAAADSRFRPDADAGSDVDAKTKDATMDAGCGADVGSDPKNCGACGHDCLGGLCAAGLCQPVVLYHGGTPSSISVDGPNLYVTVQTTDQLDGYVFRCETASCQDTVTLLAQGLALPWFSLFQDGGVYWDNAGTTDCGVVAVSGSITSCPGDGCTDSGPTAYGPDGGDEEGGYELSGLAFDSTYLYWAELRFGAAVTGRIDQCVASECAGSFVHLVSGAESLPYWVAVDTGYVYWTDLGTNQVVRCMLPSCSNNPQIFVDNLSSPTGLALHAGNVYWTENADPGTVSFCPETGCGGKPTTIASNQNNPYAVIVDDSGVYWTNIGTDVDLGTVMRCPLGSCSTPTVLASVPAAFAIALDDVSVYFTSSTMSGEVLRVAK
jgi:hypothetical protein